MVEISELMKQRLNQQEQQRNDALQVALDKTTKELGKIPAPFAFFFMGSAGREEQLYQTDQDHGIIYDGEEACQRYFLTLGEEIVKALEDKGYERCEGGVMASTKRWCRSYKEWNEQLDFWIKENQFEHVRYLLTFFDSRTVLGDNQWLTHLKQRLFLEIKEGRIPMSRFTENTGRIPKGLNGFGQLLEEQYGEYQGTINLKEQVLFPYVNGMRLLALQEGIDAASTLERMQQSAFINSEQHVMASFLEIQTKRVLWGENHGTFTHVFPETLTKEERKFLKKCIREGRSFYRSIQQNHE
ncbi:DUF294 nucleotidyltransferase-like domain-containing protein [Shouchella lehensis]|nr:DUF294 nucleotidyltransferase-like domain-containing protein [Shouchella lehensis]MBG9785208.1 hypothetical protein [Shouchella lehensis]RQW18927.1 hypothetical protein EH196_18420 [Bacillus sp. C1-1]TES46647.1 hypothetical protein E2L03_18355 [Shouchella lehensis]